MIDLINAQKKSLKEISSKELLSHLQRKSLNKNKIPKLISNDLENDENLPPTRIKEFLNNSQLNSINNTKLKKSYDNPKEQSKNQKYLFPSEITNIDNNTPSFSIDGNCTSNFNKQNKECSSPNYLNFHLHENIYNNIDIKHPLHIYLPVKYKDNEDYKLKLVKYLKCQTHNKKNKFKYYGPKSHNKEINLNKNRKSLSFFQDNFECNERNENENLICIQKCKKVISVKKKNLSKINFFNNNNKEINFSLFNDNNIGIEKNWQLPMKFQSFDNDVESDEEQINKGKEKMLYDLKLGIIRWTQKKNICTNYKYITDLKYKFFKETKQNN